MQGRNSATKIDIGIIGNCRVGKSSLREYDTLHKVHIRSFTSPEASIKKLLLDGDAIILVVWEMHQSVQSFFLHKGRGYDIGINTFLLVYDVTNHQSFQDISDWIKDGKPLLGDKLLMLVGNKCDLEREREVERRTAEELADSLNIPYIETSAKEGINVELAFVTLAAMWKKQKENVPQEKKQKDVKRTRLDGKCCCTCL